MDGFFRIKSGMVALSPPLLNAKSGLKANIQNRDFQVKLYYKIKEVMRC